MRWAFDLNGRPCVVFHGVFRRDPGPAAVPSRGTLLTRRPQLAAKEQLEQRKMARLVRLERTTYGLEGRCSIRLSYRRAGDGLYAMPVCLAIKCSLKQRLRNHSQSTRRPTRNQYEQTSFSAYPHAARSPKHGSDAVLGAHHIPSVHWMLSLLPCVVMK